MNAKELISKRVKETFSIKEYGDFAKEYLDILHGNWRIAYEKQNQLATVILFLAFAFELLTRAVISEVSLGPFKVNDLAIIHKLLPVLIAFYYLQMLNWGKKRNEIADVYYEIINICYPSITQNKLQYYLAAEGINIIGYRYRKLQNRFLRIVQDAIKVPVVFFILMAPIIFGIYAFSQLFRLFGLNDILVWLSLVSYVLIAVLTYSSYGEYSV